MKIITVRKFKPEPLSNLSISEIITMFWTKKHDEFLQACDIKGCAAFLLRYSLRRGSNSSPTEIEIDLHHFNNWIGKQRVMGKYHRKTLAAAIAKLDSHSNGMFVIIKRYSPWIYKVLVRPLHFVERMQRAKSDQPPKPPTSNPMFDPSHKERAIKQQQQNISKINSLFSKVGLKYDKSALLKIWRYSGKCLDNIVSAVELLLYRHSTQDKEISNPNGFIIEALRDCWYKDFDLNYEPDVPRFKTKAELAQFTAAIRAENKAKYGGDTIYERVKNRNRSVGLIT